MREKVRALSGTSASPDRVAGSTHCQAEPAGPGHFQGE
jgi:hypothetical protein